MVTGKIQIDLMQNKEYIQALINMGTDIRTKIDSEFQQDFKRITSIEEAATAFENAEPFLITSTQYETMLSYIVQLHFKLANFRHITGIDSKFEE